MSEHRNNVANAVSGTPGTGTITLASAVSGSQSFSAAYGANATVDVFITDGTAWEVARNCTYTHSGTTLTRGTLEASSTGSAISLTSAAVVRVAASAEWGNSTERLMRGVTPGGRLTLESGVPVSTTDQTAKTNIYYTPCVHDQIVLWDGFAWTPITFTQYTLALGTLTSGKPYDIFAYLSSGVLALEMLVWTDDTTRATGVTLQDGRYCKSGDKTRLLLGTFYTASATTTEDSVLNRLLANVYNIRAFTTVYDSGSSSHTYTTDASMREYNGTTNAARIRTMQSIFPDPAQMSVAAIVSQGSGTGSSQVVINLNSSTTLGAPGKYVVLGNLGTTGYLRSASGVISLVVGLNSLFMCDRNSGTADLTANFGSMTGVCLQ